VPPRSLLSDTENTASRSSTSIAGDLALFMVTLAQVIGAGVNDERALYMLLILVA